MHDWLIHLYYEISELRAGVKKRFLSTNEEKTTTISYYEKGQRVLGQPTLIFIHGFSSNKEAWLPLMNYIPNGYHCIMIDLPYHGETNVEGDSHRTEAFADQLRSFFDKMKLTEPMCMIGASVGGTIVSIFATKYPEYIHMLCLLSPPPIKEYESDLIKEVRAGNRQILLPETSEQFEKTIDLFTVKKVKLPGTLIHQYFKSRLRLLDNQTQLLDSFLEYEYLNLEYYYEQLKSIHLPTLILWGRQDQLCVVEGANYFAQLIHGSELIIFDDCGHFVASDNPKKTANSIIQFFNLHSYFIIE